MPYQPPPGGGPAGPASALRTTGAPVVISGAAPPSAGQVLTATSATTADWETPVAGSFPRVVASFNFTGKTGTFSFEILPDTLPTGDYQLNDVVTITTPDAIGTAVFGLTFADESGALLFDDGESSLLGGVSNVGGAGFPGPGKIYTFPVNFHAVTGTAITYRLTVTGETTLVYNIHLTLTRLQ